MVVSVQGCKPIRNRLFQASRPGQEASRGMIQRAENESTMFVSFIDYMSACEIPQEQHCEPPVGVERDRLAMRETERGGGLAIHISLYLGSSSQACILFAKAYRILKLSVAESHCDLLDS